MSDIQHIRAVVDGTLPATAETGEGGMGRLYMPDPRDAKFTMRSLPGLRATSFAPRNWKTTRWPIARGSTFQDQGATSQCTRYMMAHLLMLSPVVRKDAMVLTDGCYQWSQDNDEWPGAEPEYYGTSVRAAVQYARQQLGIVSAFYWCASMDDVLARMCAPKAQGGGPLGIGVDWWSGCDNLMNQEPKNNWWEATGWLRGGHALVVTDYIAPRKGRAEGYFWMGNSHLGNHRAKVRESMMEYWLFQANGEAVAITEVPK